MSYELGVKGYGLWFGLWFGVIWGIRGIWGIRVWVIRVGVIRGIRVIGVWDALCKWFQLFQLLQLLQWFKLNSDLREGLPIWGSRGSGGRTKYEGFSAKNHSTGGSFRPAWCEVRGV